MVHLILQNRGCIHCGTACLWVYNSTQWALLCLLLCYCRAVWMFGLYIELEFNSFGINEFVRLMAGLTNRGFLIIIWTYSMFVCLCASK